MKLILPSYFHLIFEIAAFFLGFRYYLFLRKRSGDSINEHNRVWIIVGATAGALIGSRLLGAFEDPHAIDWNSWKSIFVAFNNKSIVGGLFGGTLFVELVKKILKEKQRSGDLFVFPTLFALIIGRIGCFLTALEDHTAGGPTTLPWGIDYGDGIFRHPLPLYEIIFLVITFYLLWKLNKKQSPILKSPSHQTCPELVEGVTQSPNPFLASGSLFKLMMIIYFSYRLINEFFKEDYKYFGMLSAIQIVCIAGLLYYANVIFQPRHLLKSHA